jgi:hypothetical protein
MSMILKNHMFKVDLTRLLKMRFTKKTNSGFSKKQNRLQVDEILNIFTFSINGHLKFTYAFSTSKVMIIIFQSFNIIFKKTKFHHSISKLLLTYF